MGEYGRIALDDHAINEWPSLVPGMSRAAPQPAGLAHETDLIRRNDVLCRPQEIADLCSTVITRQCREITIQVPGIICFLRLIHDQYEVLDNIIMSSGLD